MSVKENIEVIKNALKGEEKFLEGAIKAEKFLKKYKSKLLFGGALIIGVVGYSIVNTYVEENNLVDSNEAYLQLLANPNDNKSLAVLKEKNSNLYELFVVQNAIKNSDTKVLASNFNDKFLRDISAYQLAVIEKNPSLYTGTSFTVQQDLATILEAYELIKNGKVEEGHRKLSFISLNSPVQNIAKSLLHYK